jgi:hypothetical protein
MTAHQQFVTACDVNAYFGSLLARALAPQPPGDLWEQMAKQQRLAARVLVHETPHIAPKPPEHLEITLGAGIVRQKMYPLVIMERVDAIPDVKARPVRCPKVKLAAISIRELL